MPSKSKTETTASEQKPVQVEGTTSTDSTKKSRSKKTETSTPSVVPSSSQTVSTSVPEVKEEVKTRKSKTSKSEDSSSKTSSSTSSKTSSVPEAVSPVEGSTTNTSGDSSEKKPRRKVDRETIDKNLETLLTRLDEEVEVTRQGDGKHKGLRFLRSLSKEISQLRKDFSKVSTKKTRKQSTDGKPSGFEKPVKVTSEMTNFAGLKDNQLMSRVDVTKAICAYVKSHNLQNKDDRKNFIPDEKLAKLLKSKDSCTYYNLQQRIGHHFVKA